MGKAMDELAREYAARYDVKLSTAEKYLYGTVIPRVVEILGADAGLLNRVLAETLDEREKKVETNEAALERQKEEVSVQLAQARDKVFEAEKKLEDAEEMHEKAQKEVEAVRELETPEARDKMRLLLAFLDVAEIETSQNLTAFIQGCANILSATHFVMVDSKAEPNAQEMLEKQVKAMSAVLPQEKVSKARTQKASYCKY